MALQFKTSLDDGPFMTKLKGLGNSIGEFNTSLEATGKKAKEALGTPIVAGAAAAVTGIALAARALINYGSDLRDSIDATDQTSESFQRLAFAFGQSGVEQGTYVKGMQSLALSMQEAKDGNEKTIKSFARLGIAVGELTTSDEVVLKIADAAKNASDKSESLAARLDVLGKAGKQMQAGMLDGADGLKTMGKEIAILTDVEINKLDTMGDKLQTIWTQVKQVGSKALVGFTEVYSGNAAATAWQDHMADRKAGRAASSYDDAMARGANDDRKEQIRAQKAKEIDAEIQMESERHRKAIEEDKEKKEVEAYKRRAEAFKKADEDAIKAEQQSVEDKKKLWTSLIKDWQGMQKQAEENIKEAQKQRVEFIHKRNAELLEQNHAKQMKMVEAAEARSLKAIDNLAAAKEKAEGAFTKAVQGGLQTPQERRQENIARKREEREARRIEDMVQNPWKHKGGKTGDAKRVQDVREARMLVNQAQKEVTLSQTTLDALAKVLAVMIAKP